ncbi:B-cell scaffold protein with ankyrin repeats-like, partial [Xenentodon cancila]
ILSVAEDLLIIYETEAKQWASYLKSVFTGPISEPGICCYDVTTVTSRRDDFLRLSRYACKLLILTKGMLEGLCQLRRFFLSRVLSPAAQVVVLLCGVDSLTPLLERVPLNSDECLQISSEQEAPEYLSTVVDIVRKGTSATPLNVNPLTRKASGPKQKAKQMPSSGPDGVTSNVAVIPSRVACGSSTEVFVLLKNEPAVCDCEVEFSTETQTVRVKPARWNEHILCASAPDFPAGKVKMKVYSGGKPVISTQLQYHTSMEELTRLLSKVADPVAFMCQALQVSSVDKLDQRLSSMLLESMPTRGFLGLQSETALEREPHHADVPSLLHFAARHGFRSVSGLLLQCPGAERALHTANCQGQTPIEIAKSHGHTELHILLKETLKMLSSEEDNGEAGVYEMMRNPVEQKRQQREDEEEEQEEEDLYAPLDVNDEYDTILKSETAVAIANRPPAPTPRPETTEIIASNTPYIVQVFQKKKTPQGDGDLYSLPSKQARERDSSIASTYDTVVPNQMHGLHQLAELQERAKEAALTVDEALEHFSDRPQGEKKASKQEEKLNHQRASNINNRDGDEGVYDRINFVHHKSSAPANESRGGSQPAESDFYSKSLKGQTFRKADKR